MVAVVLGDPLSPGRTAIRPAWSGRRLAPSLPRSLARCLDRVLDLLLDVRQLRQDLWAFGRHRGAAVLALAQHVRDLARCRDQRRVRATNGPGHDKGGGEATRRARRGESRFGSQRGSRGATAEMLTRPYDVGSTARLSKSSPYCMTAGPIPCGSSVHRGCAMSTQVCRVDADVSSHASPPPIAKHDEPACPRCDR